MKLFISNTSPFARIVRIVLLEKRLDFECVVVDPWSEPTALQEISPACKVPVLLLDNGIAIVDSRFILGYLDMHQDVDAAVPLCMTTFARYALAYSLLEVFASIIIGRRSHPDFDNSDVGLRRRHSLIEGLRTLENDPSPYDGEMPSVASITTVVLIDAIRFRFKNAEWIPPIQHLDRMSSALNLRKSFRSTQPC